MSVGLDAGVVQGVIARRVNGAATFVSPDDIVSVTAQNAGIAVGVLTVDARMVRRCPRDAESAGVFLCGGLARRVFG